MILRADLCDRLRRHVDNPAALIAASMTAPGSGIGATRISPGVA
jgi:hypothetical protein